MPTKEEPQYEARGQGWVNVLVRAAGRRPVLDCITMNHILYLFLQSTAYVAGKAAAPCLAPSFVILISR